LPLFRYILALLRKKIPAFFKRENIHSTWCKPDAALQNFLKQRPVDLVLVNHVFNSDFAYKYILAKKYVIETHDIQLNQLLLRRPELIANYDAELNYELDVLSQYDAVVNLNKNEHRLIENRVGAKAKYVRPAIVRRKPSIVYETLSELVAAQSSYAHIKKLPEKFDLLLVGDGHPANIESAQKFIDNVYTRLPKGTTLGIVGKLADYLIIDWNNGAFIGIHDIGFLDQLANIYDFTSLLILPDVVGEGIPIKTDEAIATLVPFLATQHALRGFSQADLDLAGISPIVSDTNMQQKIIELLESDTLRAQACNNLQALIEQYDLEDYFSKWDRVKDGIL
jgi:hypothetical protein